MDNISQAIAAIGKNKHNDYIIAPQQHAELLKDSAKPLADLLSSSSIDHLTQAYEKKDAQALEAQTTFKKWTQRSQLLVLSAVIFASLLAGMSTLETWLEPDILKIAVIVSSFMAAASSALAGICLNYIRTAKLLSLWMRKRAEAETYRLELFRQMTTSKLMHNTGEINPALFQLEYFRRYQLDVQLSYYDNRGKQHLLASNAALLMSTCIMAAVAVITILTGYAGTLNPAWAILALLAIVLQAYAAKVSNVDAINQDGRNAERYERTHNILARINANLDEVRAAVDAGKRAVLEKFVDAVHDQLSLEHRQWLDDAKYRHAALDRLNDQLKK